MQMQSGMVLLKTASQADVRTLYMARYEAYLSQYGAYGSPLSPCVQSMEAFALSLRSGNTHCIQVDGRTVGGLVMEQTENGVMLREIYIRPDYQQMGIAQVALMHAELMYPAAKYRAQVIYGEAPASGLLRKMGYKPLRNYETLSERMTTVWMEKDASSMVTLALEPMKREDLANAITWCNEDAKKNEFLPLWAHGREKLLSMAEFSKDFQFGKHYVGANQLDFSVKAVEFGVVIGVVSLVKPDWEEQSADVDYLVLDPRWRGGKLGKRIMEQLCSMANEQYGFNRLRLTVLEENERAIACFLSSGFAEVLRRQNVMRGGDESPRTRIVMMRSLTKEKT